MISRRTGIPVMLFVTITAAMVFGIPSPADASPQHQDPTPTPGSSSEAQALYAEGESLYDAGEYEQALKLFQEAAELNRASGYRMAEADALKKVGWCYSRLRLQDEAYQTYQQELLIRRELGDLRGEGVVYLNIGASFSRVGDYTNAIEFTQKSIPIIEEAGDQKVALSSYLNLAGYLRHEDEHAEALEASQKALPLAQKLGDRDREGRVWHGLGLSYKNLERYEEAVDAYYQALEIWREVGNRSNEATDLYNLAWAYSYLGEPVLGADASAAASVIKGEIDDFEDQAKYLLLAGALYLEGYSYDLAIDILQQWLESGYADDDLEYKAATLNDLSICFLGIGDYDQAMEAAEASLDVKHQIGDSEGSASSFGNLGAINNAIGNYEAALDYYDQALLLQQASGDREDEAQTLDNIGRNFLDMSVFDQAWSYFQQSLNLRREIGDQVGEVKVLIYMGVLYYDLGDMDQAMEYFQAALEMSRDIGYRDGEMRSLKNMGPVYEANKDYESAIASYEAALVLNEKVGDERAQGSLLNHMGLSYYLLGEFQEADKSYQQALRIAKEMGDRGIEAFILANLAVLEQSSGSLDEALEHFLESLQINRYDNFRSGEADTLYMIGTLYEDKGDDDLAIEYYLASLDMREAMRAAIQLDDYKSAVATTDAFAYQRAIQLLIKMGRFEDAFDLTERSRARSFLDQMGNETPSLRDGVDIELLDREQQLLQEIAALENELLNGSSVFDGQRTGSTLDVFEERLASKQQEYLDLLAEIQLANPKLASLVMVATMDVSAIQADLEPDVTLVSYYVIDETVRAFLLSKSEFESVELPGTAESYQQAIQSFRTLGLANLGNSHPKSLVDLYEGLITPILPHLNTMQVGIIPHQWLHYIPFAALSDGDQYLGEQFTLFKLPAASTLQFLGSSEIEGPATPLIFGNPTTDNPELPPLAFAAQEANLVAELFGVEAMVGDAASEFALQSQVANASILHLAAHGSFDPNAPLFSRIWLAPGEDADGRLNVHEVYGLDLENADLVVLSACQTNQGELSVGDEIVGLNRAFLYGAPTVVSSLWSVDDEATGVLMEAFYTSLLDGMEKAQALQHAQQAVRTDPAHPAWAHPYYWAAFVLSGDPGQEGSSLVKNGSAPALTLLYFMIPLVVIACALGLMGFRKFKQKRISPVDIGGNKTDESKDG